MAKTEIAEQKTTAVALPAELAAELAAEAKDAAAEERPAISKLSTRGGALAYQGNPVPGSQMEVVILAAVYFNKYYKDRFDPNDIKNPTCFALSEDGEDMAPHENVAEPVNPGDCAACPMMQWKSDPQTRKGKACKEVRRLVLIPADAIKSVDTVRRAEMAMLDLPVTSGRNYGSFVNITASTTGRPPWAVVANLLVRPDPKTQLKVEMTPLRTIDDPEVIQALRARKDDALRIALTPYDETSAANSAVSEEQKARQAKVGSKIS